MAERVPLDQVAELYNQVMGLADEADTMAAARLAFRLRQLARREPANFAVRVALARVFMLCGERQQAIDELSAAWECRVNAEVPALMTFFGLLEHVGEHARAGELIDTFWWPRRNIFPIDAALALVFHGLAVGDVELIGRAADLERRSGASPLVSMGQHYSAIADHQYVEMSGIGPDLAAHQAVVFSIVGRHQVFCEYQLYQDDDSEIPVMRMVHRVNLEWPEIRRLRRDLSDALFESFQGEGVSPAFLCHDLIPVPHTPVLQVA